MNTNTNTTSNYSFKRKIRQAVQQKLRDMSETEEEYQENKKEYNRYMDCSLEEIKNYYKEHNAQYWTNSKKYYKVLFLMKLNKKKADEIAMCNSSPFGKIINPESLRDISW